jgi:hypothetical protein
MAVVTAEDGCYVVLGGGSALLAAVPGARTGISGAGVGISGTGVGVSGAGLEAAPLSTELRHLQGEVLDIFLGCSWGEASDRRLGCDLRDVVHTAGCSVQASVFLAGEVCLYVGG